MKKHTESVLLIALKWDLLLDDTIQQVLDLFAVNNYPDLTHLWNEASFRANKNEITISKCNKIWGMLRELEKEKMCTLTDSTYD